MLDYHDYDDDILGYDDEFDYDDLDDDDILGYSDDLLGAITSMWGGRARKRRGGSRRRRARRRAPRGRAPMLARPRRLAVTPQGPTVLARPPLIPAAAGVPETAGLYIPLGLGTFTFVNAGPTTNTFTEKPEKPVRPRRLWIDLAFTAGAVGILVSVTDIKIGTKSMLAGIAAIPAGQFATGAFAKNYNLFDSAVPGVSVSVVLALSAGPGVGETVTAALSVDCDSLG